MKSGRDMGKFKAKLQWEGFKPKYGHALRTTQVALGTEAEAAAAYDGFKREQQELQIEQQQQPAREKKKVPVNYPNEHEARWNEVQAIRRSGGKPCEWCGGYCPVYQRRRNGRNEPRYRLRGTKGAFASAEEACGAHKAAQAEARAAAAAGAPLSCAV